MSKLGDPKCRIDVRAPLLAWASLQGEPRPKPD
jgi:hypothetical protein